MRSKYQIDGVSFRTKREIVGHVRAILNRVPIGESLGPDDFRFMLALLHRHPWAAQKIGVGVQAIRVDLNSQWTPCKMFTLVRTDGSETDFSYRACIYPPSHEADFREACRQVVLDDILAFKRTVFDAEANECNEVSCAATGMLVGWNEAHIDHAPPWTFKAIVDAFIDETGVDVGAVHLTGSADNECQQRFADSELTERFRTFHNARARLRVVTKAANLEASR